MTISCQNVDVLAVGTISIVSTPIGVTVEIAPSIAGSPGTYVSQGVVTTISNVEVGNYFVRLTKSGYIAWTTPSQITVTEGATTTVTAILTADTGSAAFISTPTGARIWLGPYLGTLVDQGVNTTASPGQEIIGLSPGMYDYALILDGYITATGTVTVTSGNKTTEARVLFTVADITATNVVVTRSSNPCIVGNCTITVDVTWTNNGQTAGDITPTIEFKVGGILTRTVAKAYTITIQPNGGTNTQSFAVSNLTAEVYTVCPVPN